MQNRMLYSVLMRCLMLLLCLPIHQKRVSAQECGDCFSPWIKGYYLSVSPPSSWNIDGCQILIDYSYRQCIVPGIPPGTQYELQINSIKLKDSSSCDFDFDSIVKFSHKVLLERSFSIFSINTSGAGFSINITNPACLHLIANDYVSCDSNCCKTNYQISKIMSGVHNEREKYVIDNHTNTSSSHFCVMEDCNYSCGLNVEDYTTIGDFYTGPNDCEDDCYWTLYGNNYVNSSNWLGTKNLMPLKVKTTNAERMRITEDGRVGIRTTNPFGWLDVNVGSWNCNMGKISFDSRNVEPQIRFYRPTGTDFNCNTMESFSWHLEMDNRDLKFKSSPTSTSIGQETPNAYVTMKGSTGNVGINTESPTAKLQVENGSVLFNGTTGSTPVSGAGTRLMWIPEKAAFRGGYISDSSWDNNNIGYKSFAFGQNANAYYTHDIALGLESYANSKYWTYTGYDSTLYHGAVAIGHSAKSRAFDAIAIGLNTLANSRFAIAIGQYAKANNDFNIAIGQYVSAGNFPDTTKPDGYQHCFVFGSGIKDDNPSNLLSNNIPNSMIFGVNSNKSTVFLNGGSQRYVGIGTDNPLGALYVNTSNIAGGAQNRGVMIGKSWVSDSIPMQLSIGVDLAVQGKIGIGNTTSLNKVSITGSGDNNQVLIWSSDQSMISGYDIDLLVEKKVVIGSNSLIDTAPSSLLQVHGNVYATDFIKPSDRKLKKDIERFYQGINVLKQINPVTYKYKSEYGFNDNETQIGIIAQDIREILPFTVRESLLKRSEIVETEKITIDTVYTQFNANIEGRDTVMTKQSLIRKTIPAQNEIKEEEILTFRPNDLIYLTINAVKDVDSLRVKDSILAGTKIRNLSLLIDNLYKSLDSISVVNQNLIQNTKVLEESINYLKKCCESNNIDIYDDVLLEQNSPNPFDKSTIINYFIPDRLFPPFEIIITNIDGSIMYDKIVVENGTPKSITISAANYQTGVYNYSIINAGKVIKSKKMMIIK